MLKIWQEVIFDIFIGLDCKIFYQVFISDLLILQDNSNRKRIEGFVDQDEQGFNISVEVEVRIDYKDIGN